MLTEGLLHNQTKPPTRQQLETWCTNCMKEKDEQIVKNAWLHGEYSFFPADVAAHSGGALVADPYDAHDEMLMDEEDEMDEDEMLMDEE